MLRLLLSSLLNDYRKSSIRERINELALKRRPEDVRPRTKSWKKSDHGMETIGPGSCGLISCYCCCSKKDHWARLLSWAYPPYWKFYRLTLDFWIKWTRDGSTRFDGHKSESSLARTKIRAQSLDCWQAQPNFWAQPKSNPILDPNNNRSVSMPFSIPNNNPRCYRAQPKSLFSMLAQPKSLFSMLANELTLLLTWWWRPKRGWTLTELRISKSFDTFSTVSRGLSLLPSCLLALTPGPYIVEIFDISPLSTAGHL